MRKEDYFCPFCGAENFATVYDSTYTYAQNNTNTEQRSSYTYTSADEESRDRKYGIRGAICAVIMAGVTTLMLSCALISAIMEFVLGMGVFLFLAFGTGIVAGILGIKSVNAYKRMVREGRAKPVATLVMGIIGMVIGAETVVSILLGAYESFFLL